MVTLPADTNQALGIADYASVHEQRPAKRGGTRPLRPRTHRPLPHRRLPLRRLARAGTNAPTLLRSEALNYPAPQNVANLGNAKTTGATVFGSSSRVQPEKAVVANSSAVREWDSNGTNFGYNPKLGHTAGEFGHNDFYPVCIAAAQMLGADGAYALRGMMLLDEIRGRLAEVFSSNPTKSITSSTAPSQAPQHSAPCSAQHASRSRAPSAWSSHTPSPSAPSAPESSSAIPRAHQQPSAPSSPSSR